MIANSVITIRQLIGYTSLSALFLALAVANGGLNPASANFLGGLSLRISLLTALALIFRISCFTRLLTLSLTCLTAPGLLVSWWIYWLSQHRSNHTIRPSQVYLIELCNCLILVVTWELSLLIATKFSKKIDVL